MSRRLRGPRQSEEDKQGDVVWWDTQVELPPPNIVML